MRSRTTLFLRRIVPGGLRRSLKRTRGLLLLRSKNLEYAGREQFFHGAFRALRFNGIDGDYAEFGCHGARTFALAHQAARRSKQPVKLWAFDSFQGLPPAQGDADAHRHWKAGKMATSLEDFHRLCAAERIPRESYQTVVGFYAETLDRMADGEEPKNIALAYVDCDLYSSTRSVLRFLEPRLKHGMILAFDDYHNWSPTQISGERRALLEVFEDHPKWSLLPFLPIGWHGASFVVERRALLPSRRERGSGTDA